MISANERPASHSESGDPMETVISADGTAIAYRRSGHGSPLVLVHGSTADHTVWMQVLPTLEEHHTVYAVDRRGRGVSDDATSYAIEREFEDVVAVVDAIGGPVVLLGHSFGGLCALEAALRTNCLHKLVLYEPGLYLDVREAEHLARVEALLDAGQREEALKTFYRDLVKMAPQDIEVLPSLPTWPARVAAAHTITREMRTLERYHFDPARFCGVQTPTVLLYGGDSPPWAKTVTEMVHTALPHSRIIVMPGQQHIAMRTAPDLFARTVLQALAEE